MYRPAKDKGFAASILTVARKYLAANVRERPDGSNKGAAAAGQPAQYSVDAIQKPFGLPGQPLQTPRLRVVKRPAETSTDCGQAVFELESDDPPARVSGL